MVLVNLATSNLRVLWMIKHAKLVVCVIYVLYNLPPQQKKIILNRVLCKMSGKLVMVSAMTNWTWSHAITMEVIAASIKSISMHAVGAYAIKIHKSAPIQTWWVMGSAMCNCNLKLLAFGNGKIVVRPEKKSDFSR